MCADIALSLYCAVRLRRTVQIKNGSLLGQAYEWERLAMTELEAHFTIPDGQSSAWEMAVAA